MEKLMRTLDEVLKNRELDKTKLQAYGFMEKQGNYHYEQSILDGLFHVVMDVNDRHMTSKLIETECMEEYELVDVISATGSFIGKVREAYEQTIEHVLDHCTIASVYKSRQTIEVINYIKEKYEDDIEFLWKNSPKNGVFRHKENQKWYAILLEVSKHKLGFDDHDFVEILDLKYPEAKINELIDHKSFFGGYHMNKKHWITILLDDTLPLTEIYHYIDISYQMK